MLLQFPYFSSEIISNHLKSQCFFRIAPLNFRVNIPKINSNVHLTYHSPNFHGASIASLNGHRKQRAAAVATQVFCVATSRIILSEQRAVDAVEAGGVGIAQLFKHFRRRGRGVGHLIELWWLQMYKDYMYTYIYIYIWYVYIYIYIVYCKYGMYIYIYCL